MKPTKVELLKKKIKNYENLIKEARHKIKEIQANCKHEFNDPQYGIYIVATCRKCGKDEWR